MKPKSKQPLIPKLRFPEFRDAGEWEECLVEDFFHVGSSKRVLQKDWTKEGVPFYRTRELVSLSKNESFTSEVFISEELFSDISERYGLPTKGDFLVSGVGTLGIAHQVRAEDRFYFKDGNVLWLKLTGDIISDFFKYCFNSDFIQDQILGQASISTVGTYTIQNAKKTKFIRPPQSIEQQKIADCLSSVDDLIAAHGRKLTALQNHKKGLMQQLFPQDGENQPRLRFPEFQDAGEWQNKTLIDACKMQAGKFVAASKIKEQNAAGLFPCYGGNGLRGFTETQTHNGTYPLIGRQGALCGNVKLAVGRFHATEHAVVATPNDGVDVVWLYYLLDLLNLNQFATGQAQPGLSVDVLEKVSVTIPKDEKEQRRIADCFSALDDQIAAQSQKIAALQRHKKGLMQQLFPNSEEGAKGAKRAKDFSPVREVVG
jgi:type I restriction enzyme S subunit